MVNIKDVLGSLDEQNSENQKQQQDKAKSDSLNRAKDAVVGAVNQNTQSTAEGLKSVKGEVTVTNPDLAKSQDVNLAVEAINKLNLTTFMQNEGLPKLAENLASLSTNVQELQDKYENEALKKMGDQLALVVKKLTDLSKGLSSAKVQVDAGLQKTIDGLKKSIDRIDFKPSVNVSSPPVNIPEQETIDLSPLTALLGDIKTALAEQEQPELNIDPIIGGLAAVEKTIASITFPSSNFILPFRDNVGKATQVSLDANGNLPVKFGSDSTASILATGNIASGVTDSGAPVKVGAVYNTSAPSLTNGQRGDLQIDTNANLKVTLATLLAGEDLTNNVIKTEQQFSFSNITSATTTTPKSASGFLHSVVLNTPIASATITIYDNTAGSGTTIGKITLGATLANDMETTFLYDVKFTTGLTLVTSGATDITVSWR